jgi:hypothetical protein
MLADVSLSALAKPGFLKPESVPFLTRHYKTLLWLIVGLGLTLRCYHYLLDPVVWHDEAALINNVLLKDYADFLGAIYYAEACPPLFLVLEKAMAGILGDGTLALRLVPMVAGCLTLVILVITARRVLPRGSLLILALLTACSERLLWHCTEAKPYSVDALVGAGLLAAMVHSERGSRVSNWLLASLAVLTPALVFLSFPAVFLLGGMVLTLLPGARHGRCNRWLYATFVVAVCVSFLTLWATAIGAQRNETILECWDGHFLDWQLPWLVPGLTLLRVTEVARYAAEPTGNVLSVLALIGGVWLWRTGQRRLVGFCVWSLTLNVAAWWMGSYPLEACRVVVYLAPAALLLVAAGVDPVWRFMIHLWSRDAERTRRGYTMRSVRALGRLALPGLMVLLSVPVLYGAWYCVRPWHRLDSAGPAAFVLSQRHADEPVVGCLWEQQYYCRELNSLYRHLVWEPLTPPSVPAAAASDGRSTMEPVRGLWILTSTERTVPETYLQLIAPAAPWRIAQTTHFRDITVFHVIRD